MSAAAFSSGFRWRFTFQASQAFHFVFIIKNTVGVNLDPRVGLVEGHVSSEMPWGASYAFIAADMALWNRILKFC